MDKYVYITKWTLNQGIIKAKVKEFRPNDSVRVEEYDEIQFYKPDWHSSKEEAILQAEFLVKRKIHSLEKQIKKLKKTNFRGAEIKKKVSDYDVWHKKCSCGYDPGKSREGKCWQCGRKLQRDYSDRALKINRKN